MGSAVMRISCDGQTRTLHEARAANAANGSPRPLSVPFMLTQYMKRRLRACGYSDEAIAHLTPRRAHEILAQEGRRPNA